MTMDKLPNLSPQGHNTHSPSSSCDKLDKLSKPSLDTHDLYTPSLDFCLSASSPSAITKTSGRSSHVGLAGKK